MASLDMSLDDMIKSSRSNTERGRGQGGARRRRGGPISGGRMTGVPRRSGGPLRVNTARPSASTIAKSVRITKSSRWQHDLVQESLKAVGLPGIGTDAKLFVSNLDGRVSNEDIRELFSEIGELKRYAIHYDKNGRPSGSAEVVFTRRSDAFLAVKRYNNVQLDGKPMKIEIVGSNSEIPFTARWNVVRGAPERTVVAGLGVGRGRGFVANRISSQRNHGGTNNGRGGTRNGGGRGRGNGTGRGRGRGRGGRGGKRNVDKSADELDKELENYHAKAEAMQA